ncbi:hypothetical protein O7606_12260 [Micromonospora sp. WMMD882]|uniref:hypothetical protein n=1 Tax=Micromonospora sp. WMMD882 TaxID=3015151 RepID=UPI00248D0988|nr:hypothetical protein [Micromonospora sp. WMMD882]WBB82063.1 hypothetical protein O7606_12260 [Micromonospora sp. WMMD882]
MTSRWRDLGVALGVLTGLGALTVVPAIVSAGLPTEGPPLTRPVDVGHGVRIDPPPGARLDVTDSRPGAGEVVLRTADGLRIRLTAVAYQGDPEPFTAHARHRLARDELLRPAGRPEPLRAAGLRGEWGPLTGEQPACYAVLTGPEVAVTALVTPVDGCAELPAPVRAALTGLRSDPS